MPEIASGPEMVMLPVADTVSLFTTTINTIFDIKAALEEARELLVSIQPTSDAAFRANIATRFDGKITKLNNEVDNATSGNRNLLRLVDRVNFNTGVNLAEIGGGGVISISGNYVGTEYHIKEADGSYWLLDTTRTRLADYTSYPNGYTGTAYDLDDLVVDSYDPATGSITISGPEAISGTLVRGGLGVVNSFLYNGFAAAGALERAGPGRRGHLPGRHRQVVRLTREKFAATRAAAKPLTNSYGEHDLMAAGAAPTAWMDG